MTKEEYDNHKLRKNWEETAERHASPSGWATLGAAWEGGVCQCPVCQMVREFKDKT